MKKKTKGIVAGIIGLAAVGSILSPNKSIESIELSIPNYQTEYDINSNIPVDISILPEDADTSSLEYMADSDAITFTDAEIITGTEEGSYKVYIASGNVKSDAITINVVDISTREELARAEEERQAKEKADKEAEEKAAKEAEEKAAKEAEEKAAKEAEEKAAREAEEKAVNEQTSDTSKNQVSEVQTSAQEVDSQNNTTSSGGGISTPESEVTTPVGDMVWLSATGEKYHRINNCGKMNPDKARQISLEEAISMGYEKCSKCF